MTDQIHPRLLALQWRLGNSTLTPLADPKLSARGIELWIKRDDLLHPIISGNKWRKLKYILNDALNVGAHALVSMGGAYSNHLHALAYIGKCLGLKTVAYVRGEQPAIFNPTLGDLRQWGMELRFVSRGDYRQLRGFKGIDMPDLRAGQYWLPEGGAAELALKGVAEIVDEIPLRYEHLFVPCGTGTTLAGLIGAVPAHSRVTGVAVLKGADFLRADVTRLLAADSVQTDWEIILDYHFGGFAKSSPALTEFVSQFIAAHGITLEAVYSGKLLYAVYDLLQKDYFKRGQRVVVIHTGGLQGARPCISHSTNM